MPPTMTQDLKLRFRLLLKYPGLTLAPNAAWAWTREPKPTPVAPKASQSTTRSRIMIEDACKIFWTRDDEILKHATALHRVVVTHDLAFSRLEVRGGELVGIIYLRQGTSSRRSVLGMIETAPQDADKSLLDYLLRLQSH